MPETKPQLPEYEKLKQKLHDTILKKHEIDKELAQFEEEIYTKESEYFSECLYGNIIKGFENFHKSNPANVSTFKRKFQFTDDDRIFSLSSASYIKHLKKTNGSAAVASLGLPANIGKMVDDDDLIDEIDSVTGTPSSNGRKRKKED
ncbi:hypothetical protein BABINDRAFT_162952 [Babjeviella inositovora NRRL Y-12698]|uniref:Chromatin modification-related protein EAF6 n=1 Tax=Babjeviella inositovora NRRL Y-12698 TaxID=984486 RepID=A0A1E3QKV1_9ASCO|nr:uncharacterized protein BABINDRAFT_162952 [Babjeviella inositovora NRRL Y-12698]ODQ78305.1 hypothetical protein BABINDRAFT_162952 [Babjeviella inositovora NRRL Y-12698]